jgi:hypothetical protein
MSGLLQGKINAVKYCEVPAIVGVTTDELQAALNEELEQAGLPKLEGSVLRRPPGP